MHIPFCESKCIYCDFASFVENDDIKSRYIKSLKEEIELSKFRNCDVDTIFFGGGTPSCLDADKIALILNTIKENFNVKNAEITIECNPNSVNKAKLEKYLECGFNRISFGVQSLDDKLLKQIGRLHDRQCALNAIELAKECGFKNINADLLIGLPDPTKVLEDAQKLIEIGVTHISAYMLEVNENTPLASIVKNNPSFLPDDDECIKMYDELVKLLKDNGFYRYEISNFAKEGYECKHNLKYWSGEEYLGFGLSASSYIEEKRITNAKNFQDYFNRKNIFVEKLTSKQKIEEKIMLGLRCKLGLSKKDLVANGYNIEKNPNYSEFLNKKILFEKGDRVYLNPDYYGVSSYITIKLFKN